MLEPCKRGFYTITANYNVSREAVDCHIHSVTYDVVATPIRPTNREIRYGARVALAAVPNWVSSGHLRRCSDADTTN
eukprot:scaffold7585_cov243-Skeletonema_marinoi.AAC.3